MAFDQTKIAAPRPLKVPGDHPIAKLFSELPWLAALTPVRIFFELTLAANEKRLKRAEELALLRPIDDPTTRAALIYFENIPADVVVAGRRLNLYHQYQNAILLIDRTARNVPQLRERSIEAFCRTVAVLMHGIRHSRPTRP
jgi:hypothetical protein